MNIRIPQFMGCIPKPNRSQPNGGFTHRPKIPSTGREPYPSAGFSPSQGENGYTFHPPPTPTQSPPPVPVGRPVQDNTCQHARGTSRNLAERQPCSPSLNGSMSQQHER